MDIFKRRALGSADRICTRRFPQRFWSQGLFCFACSLVLIGCGDSSDSTESDQAPAAQPGPAGLYRFTQENPGEVKARLGTQYRTVLAMPREAEGVEPPAAASYTSSPVMVPALAPRLDFGIGTLPAEGEPSAPITFTVSIRAGDATQPIFTHVLNTGEFVQPLAAQWVDVSLDLRPWAGQQATFAFFAATADGTLYPGARWAAPILYAAVDRQADTPPNVLIISLDTLRADHLGCYGYSRDTSPNLDAIAKQSFVFEECIAPSSWTLPSHATMFTGLSPASHGAYAFSTPRLRDSCTTISELARDAGYLTAAFTEGAYVGGQLGMYQGFDLYSNGRPTGPKTQGAVEETFGNGLAWMERYREQPFFMFLHTYEIHWPYYSPQHFANKFTAAPIDPVQFTEDIGKNDFSGAGFMVITNDPGQRRDIVDLYDGGIAHTDAVLGNLFARLKSSGLLENTIVVITSDHGEGFWEHGLASHGTMLYREVLHVPLIIRLPGKNPPSGRVSGLVALADLFPTLLERLGIDHPATEDAFSLNPLINGAASDYPRTAASAHLNQEVLHRLMITVETADGKYIATTHSNVAESPLHGYWGPTRGFEPGVPEDILMNHLKAGKRDWWTLPNEEVRQPMYLAAREEMFLYPNDKAEQVDVSRKLVDLSDKDIETIKAFRQLMASEVAKWKADGANMRPNEPIRPLSDEEKRELGALGYIQ